MKTILVIGISGLIGNTIFNYFSKNYANIVYGTCRSLDSNYRRKSTKNIFWDCDIRNFSHITSVINKLQPHFVINCVGITKHHSLADSPLEVIPINSYFPHYLNYLSSISNFKLIHISSDCVFSGMRGNYSEDDNPDALDFYGRSKALGEVTQGSSITLRTSTIGHELYTSFGLLEWFLKQEQTCQGFKHAYFTGLTTLELANIIDKYIIPNSQLRGLYHVGASRISKFSLLMKIAQIYKKKIEIIPDYEFKIDRSLISSRFYKATGYKPPSWSHMIEEMYLNK